jgi:hypothetical protein
MPSKKIPTRDLSLSISPGPERPYGGDGPFNKIIVSEPIVKYLCLIYHDEQKLDAMSQAQMDALVGACIGWVGELEQGGHHIVSAGLQSPVAATTVRYQNGKMLANDGPFSESKEVLGGFTLIEARDLNEAIQLASKFPNAHLGSVEVRPVLDPDAEMSLPLDRKIGTAFRRSASEIDASAASRVLSIPRTGRDGGRRVP